MLYYCPLSLDQFPQQTHKIHYPVGIPPFIIVPVQCFTKLPPITRVNGASKMDEY